MAFDTVVPKGTQCQAPNSIVFETLEDAPIASGVATTTVKAEATLDGTIGNDFLVGQVNQVINWNQPFALTVRNTDVTAGGSDDETDDQYRYRIWLAIESYSTCGPHDAYEFWALSADPGIIQAVVYSAPNIAGEVWIYPLMRGGLLPDQDILDAVLASCNDVKRRPVSDFVSVFAPTQVFYTLNMDYYIEDTNEVLADTIQANVAQAVNDWILWQHSYVSRDLNCDELRKRCLEAGAKRIVVNSPTPTFQVMAYNQLACHSTTPPTVNYKGLEPP
jgi:phage-related baseplate assembly protein